LPIELTARQFYQLADRLEMTAADSDLYPIPDTPENIAIMEAAIQRQVKKLEKESKD